MKQTTSIQKKETTMKENQEPGHQSRMNESFFVRRPAAPGGQHAGNAVNAYNLQPVTVKREPAILNHTMFFMKKFLRRGGMFITAMLFANLFFALSSFSQVVVVNPSSPWTVPAGVTSIKVEVWGAGGGGGAGVSFIGTYGGGGGGGGAYNVATFSVTPGHTFNITIGTGGSSAQPGGATTVSGADGNVSANGGGAGEDAHSTGFFSFVNGSGGSGATGVHNGGAGGTSTGNGAGGGGGAGNNGNGSDGDNAVTGSGGAGTYAGGNGGAFRGDNGNGNNGVAPGGGGAGGRGNNNGGTGGAGQVIISYCPTITASATKNDVQCFNTSTGQIIVSGSGGTAPYTFSIDNGTSYQASNTFSGLPIGSYQIRVKDANGCESKSVQ